MTVCPPTSRSAAAYHPELDCLRFAAFALVFLHHHLPQVPDPYGWADATVAEWLAGAVRAGGYGVDVFFVLSAFLISDLLLRELRTFGKVDVLAFYVRRILRIWPLYFLLVLAAFIVSPADKRQALLWFAGFVGNWYCAAHGYAGTIADPLWSVSIEEQFYLVIPLAMVFFGPKRPLVLAGLLMALAWGVRLFLVTCGAPHPAIWCNTFCRLDPIACGLVLGVLRSRLLHGSLRVRLALVVAACVTLIVCGRYDTYAGRASLAAYPAVALASSLILVAVFGMKIRLGWFTSLWIYLGKISYGLYAFSFPALWFVQAFHLNTAIPTMVVSFLIDVLLAAASYHFWESPFLRWKRKFARVSFRDF